MFDQLNRGHTGWARFSDDMTMRYRLGRILTENVRKFDSDGDWVGHEHVSRIVFVMLNPSTADAFDLDPTVNECRKRALALGGDILEVVNLFAWRTPYPAELLKRASGQRGDDHIATAEIFAACKGARYVIAAWGNHGDLGGRAAIVTNLLRQHGIKLHHLGFTLHGHPKHPLARGKHRIPADQPLLELL